jgi:hypothetical protein
VSSNRRNKGKSVSRIPESEVPVVCSSCGALIRATHPADGDPLCLICHARVLNEYLHNLRERSDGKRVSPRVASE